MSRFKQLSLTIVFILITVAILKKFPFNVVDQKPVDPLQKLDKDEVFFNGNKKSTSVSANRRGNLNASRIRSFDGYLDFFIKNNSKLKDGLRDFKIAQGQSQFDCDLSYSQNSMSYAMRYHTERIKNGSKQERNESIAIFELAVRLSQINIDSEAEYASIDKLSQELISAYPEFREQIQQAAEIRSFHMRSYVSLTLEDALVAISNRLKTGDVKNVDFSFFSAIHNYYKNNHDDKSRQEVILQTLNYYTGSFFSDQDIDWWFADFISHEVAPYFLNSNNSSHLYRDGIIE